MAFLNPGNLRRKTLGFFSVQKAVGRSRHRGEQQRQKKIEDEFSHCIYYASRKRKKQDGLIEFGTNIQLRSNLFPKKLLISRMRPLPRQFSTGFQKPKNFPTPFRKKRARGILKN